MNTRGADRRFGHSERSSYLTEIERHQLVVEWNDTQTSYPNKESIAELFEAAAESHPDHVAICHLDQHLTYDQLNRASNRLARRLRELGVGPDARVAICMNRGAEMVMAALATLKAGGAYVPLDPAYPSERLVYMFKDSAPVILLTREAASESLVGRLSGVPVLCLHNDAPQWASQSEENPDRSGMGLEARSLAYIIYTSGSTGSPKGVAIEHGNVVNFINWGRSAFDEDALDRTLFSTSLNFDLAVYECFVPLTSGASTKVVRNALDLSESELDVTLVNTVPSAMKTLVDTGKVPMSVRVVNLAGEALKQELVESIFAETEVEMVCNLYGPSETTTYSTWVAMRREEGFAVHIGTPIANTGIYILDERNDPTPVGVSGEIYIGGKGVSRGYLNRPAVTAERFSPDPFSGEVGARMYRTGDLGCWLPEGKIRFLGRNDFQVKIRGYRIELGEIEACLCSLPGVREGVVLAREDQEGDKRLVAYYTGEEMVAEALRTHLSSKLPEYMIPSAYMRLESLPLTPNGKLDRRALPAPDSLEMGIGEYEEPRTISEQMIAGIWGEALGLERVGRRDNFFWVGGHSLIGAKVNSRVRERLGVEVGVKSLFENPTLEEFAKEIEGRMREGRSGRMPGIERRRREGAERLSYQQEGLWFIDQLQPGSSTYNIPTSLHISGELHILALEQSLSELARRHETLRTTFSISNGQPIQIIGGAEPINLPIVDLSGLQGSERAAMARELAREEGLRPFDLAKGPVVRQRVIRECGQEHNILVTMHHILGDAWSIQIFNQEVGAIYEAYRKGECSALEELKIQYADYAAWQRDWMQGEVLERGLSYWREKLAGAPSALELAMDRPRPAAQPSNGAYRNVELDRDLTRRIKELSRREGNTLYMTLLAGFKAVLGIWTGAKEIVVGTPTAGRNSVEVERLIGYFVNTVALRTNLDGSPSLGEVMRRVREVALEAYTHQDVPFEKLVEELQPERSLGRSPLFQVMFVLQIAEGEIRGKGGMDYAEDSKIGGTAKFDLTVALREEGREEGEELKGTIEYNTDIFEGTTIERLARQWIRVLESMIVDRRRLLSQVDVISEAERHQLLVEWNDAQTSYPNKKSIAELFEEEAETHPDSVAISHLDQHLTYDRLDCSSNQLARLLRASGVGPEVVVALLLDRSPRMIMALLGILKAGGAYLPLDPQQPNQRLSMMLEDAGSLLVVTESWLSERLPSVPAPVICLDTIEEAMSRQSRHRLNVCGVADNLAYVMYTSGTTGRPKGISIIQRAVVGLVKEVDYVRLMAGETMLQYAPMSFDASTFEVWGCLLNGGRLVIAPQQHLSPQELGALAKEQGVRTLWLTAGLFHLMVDEGVEWLSGVEQLLAGGDVLSVGHVKRALEMGVRGSVINGYGPTESTTFACSFKMSEVGEVGRSVAIGRPISNKRVYVLDEMQRVAPIGVVGELYIGGEGLARDYVKRPELVAEKFIADPYSGKRGQRMYRTGDLGRYLPDGRIEFLGRIDHQVKVRGFRIELGEIEAVINQHEKASESVVVAQEDQTSGRRLVAYVVSERGEEIGWAELRQYLGERLPDYMVPGMYVRMKELPLTANGKVDRRALPAPDSLEMGSGEYEEPRTVSEQMIAGIWGEALGLERVGRRDNFFWVGGHSLIGAQVISWVRERLGVEVGVKSLFENPTLEEFAKEVEERMRDGRSGRMPDIERRKREGIERLSYEQEGLWFIDQLQPGRSTYNIPVAFRLTGRLNISLLEQCFNEIARRHDSLRTSFAIEDGQPVRVIAARVSIPVSLVDVKERAGFEQRERVSALMRDEARRPFDLSARPLMRVKLLELAETERLLLLTMHHIISDGWSLGVLYDELTDLYSAFASGSCSPLPETRIEYADFALWQREWLQGDVLESLVSYWLRQLGNTNGVLTFPSDHPRSAIPAHHGAYEFHLLPKPLSDALKALSKEEGVTLFMLMLAAFKIVLHCYTGQSDITVGSSTANRTVRDIEGLIGFFVNTLALRTSMGGDPSFVELLGRVRETALGAYAHQALPFEKLVEALQPERDLSYNPLFQVMFELQSFPKVPALGGVILNRVSIDQGAAHFDMTLSVEPTIEEMIVTVQYDADLFDRNTIMQLLERYQALLEIITANPENQLSTLKSAMGIIPAQPSGEIMPQQGQEVAGPRNIKEELFHRKSQLSMRRDRLTPSQRTRLEKRLRGEE